MMVRKNTAYVIKQHKNYELSVFSSPSNAAAASVMMIDSVLPGFRCQVLLQWRRRFLLFAPFYLYQPLFRLPWWDCQVDTKHCMTIHSQSVSDCATPKKKFVDVKSHQGYTTIVFRCLPLFDACYRRIVSPSLPVHLPTLLYLIQCSHLNMQASMCVNVFPCHCLANGG